MPLTNRSRRALLCAALLLSAWPARAAGHALRPWPARTATPALALTGADGRSWDLRALRGKVVVLNFWASWCAPCVDELPVLNAAAQVHGDDVVVLGVNFKESPEAVARFAAAHPFAYPVLLDPAGAAARAWTGGILPTTVLIDRAGRARWRTVGELDPADPTFLRTLDTMRGGAVRQTIEQ